MPSITVKNVPEDLYRRLKQMAAADRRSLHSEIIACIERSVRSTRLDPDELLTTARQLRERTSRYVISDEDFDSGKNAAGNDRPRHQHHWLSISAQPAISPGGRSTESVPGKWFVGQR